MSLIPARTRRPAVPAAALALALAFAAVAAPPARADKLTTAEVRDLAAAANDPARAAEAASRLRKFLAGPAEPPYDAFAHQMLVRALITGNAPTPEVVSAAHAAENHMMGGLANRVYFELNLAQTLATRDDGADAAHEFALRALAILPPEAPPTVRGLAEGTLGSVYLKRGQLDSAVVMLGRAASVSPDSQLVLFFLGSAYEKAGKTDQAIGAYVRSAGVFLGEDSSAVGPLHALWQKKHGSLAGLDQAVAKAHAASVEKIAFDSRRAERAAPDWKLPDFDGHTVSSERYKGKVVVLDFWGSWCGPCRLELPEFQKMYARYRSHPGVRFMSVNWEQPTGADSVRTARARAFIAQNSFDFPVVIDHQRTAVQAFGVNAFPTVYLIDPQGTIRYVNVGYTEGIDQILELQIHSLLPKQ